VDVMRTFVGIHDLKIHHVTHDGIVVGDAVAPEHVPCAAGNIQCLAAGIAFDETDEIGRYLARRQHFARLKAALQGQTDLGLHVR